VPKDATNITRIRTNACFRSQNGLINLN